MNYRFHFTAFEPCVGIGRINEVFFVSLWLIGLKIISRDKMRDVIPLSEERIVELAKSHAKVHTKAKDPQQSDTYTFDKWSLTALIRRVEQVSWRSPLS